jgi:hypothetical protein
MTEFLGCRGVEDGGSGGVFEQDACGLEASRFGEVVDDAVGGFGVGEAGRGADVGDAVALGVGTAGAGVPGEIDTEGVWRAEAGALADEEQGDVGGEELTDGVGEGDAGVGEQRDKGQGRSDQGEQMVEEGEGVELKSEGREAVGEDDGEARVWGGRTGA